MWQWKQRWLAPSPKRLFVRNVFSISEISGAADDTQSNLAANDSISALIGTSNLITVAGKMIAFEPRATLESKHVREDHF